MWVATNYFETFLFDTNEDANYFAQAYFVNKDYKILKVGNGEYKDDQINKWIAKGAKIEIEKLRQQAKISQVTIDANQEKIDALNDGIKGIEKKVLERIK